MSWFEAMVLGFIQGLTEFLPISSSAHLRISAALFGWEDPGAAFTAVTQIGTELAVVIYFRHDIATIARAWARSIRHREHRHDPDARLGWLVILGSLPIGVLGLLLQDQIETAFRDLRVTAATLIVFGVLLGVADKIGAKTRGLKDLTVRHGVLYGFAQALALVPGVSRSGGTITAGLLLGYERGAATRYAFLLALPAVFASGLFQLTEIGEGVATPWGPTLLATAIAFVIGLMVIAWLMRYLSTRTFMPFVAYRLALGVLLLGLIMGGILDPDAGIGTH
ncbi:MAG: undecaprenyl-diphosphate phosphatase [Actinomycetota bacterium]|nr:undecaprenyl-diphosphate phosphatase [Actinomycetota bacterium]